jgi:hypothetical protein
LADRVSEEERRSLLEELRTLVKERGAETFLAAPLREPTPRDFPDSFEPTVRGVETLLRRILGYAGIGEYDVVLETFSRTEEIRELDDRGEKKAWGHDGAAAWFAGISEGRVHFGVAEENMGGDPTTLVATLCHEVAHAWRHHHGLAEVDRDAEELLTDLSTVYLGFGVLTTNGAYVYRQGGEYTGTVAISRWSHSRAGYLSPESMSFLLAVQVKARGIGWWGRRRIAGRLEANQSAHFRWALGTLGSSRDVREALGIDGGRTPASGHSGDERECESMIPGGDE